ncbi:MAG TPA: VOC family protein [Candidatus Bathyarchaeia archaeon]|nr:VOC family protein [Candidatus Bathyarchaeia archaeon]
MDHTIVHFEIPANNVEQIRKFYENLFGWKIFKAPMPGQEYWLIHTVPTDEKGMLLKPGISGGLFPRQPQQKELNQVNYTTRINRRILGKIRKIRRKNTHAKTTGAHSRLGCRSFRS